MQTIILFPESCRRGFIHIDLIRASHSFTLISVPGPQYLSFPYQKLFPSVSSHEYIGHSNIMTVLPNITSDPLIWVCQYYRRLLLSRTLLSTVNWNLKYLSVSVSQLSVSTEFNIYYIKQKRLCLAQFICTELERLFPFICKSYVTLYPCLKRLRILS